MEGNKHDGIGITVNELLRYLESEKQKGHGDYKLFITDDEEANGYHAMYYLGVAADELDEEELDLYERSNCDLVICDDEHTHAIYMG